MENIFITGAASGIGAATARLFAARGWRVGLADRQSDAAQALARELGGPAHAVAYGVDVLDRAGMRAALADFAGPQGRLAALFNCAGLLDMRPFTEASLDRLDAIVDVNVKGVVNGIAQALPFLKAHGNARIVSMSSAAAIYGVPDLAVYAASKFAVRGLTEALNLEFERLGIWVCDVMVGYVDTPMLSTADATAKSVALAGVHVTADTVAQTVFSATQARELHWYVREEDRAAQAVFDAATAADRRRLMGQSTGY